MASPLTDHLIPALDHTERALAVFNASKAQIPPGVFRIVQQHLIGAQEHLQAETTEAMKSTSQLSTVR